MTAKIQTLTELLLSQKDGRIAELVRQRNEAWHSIDELNEKIEKLKAAFKRSII